MFKGLETQHKLSHHQNIEENKNNFNFTKEIERFNQLYNVGSKVSVFALYRKLKVAHRCANKMTFFNHQAQDDKDVYETDDLPSSEPEYYEEEADNDSIDRSKLNTADAYTKFKGKYLIGNVDFSDSIGRRRCIGYNAV